MNQQPLHRSDRIFCGVLASAASEHASIRDDSPDQPDLWKDLPEAMPKIKFYRQPEAKPPHHRVARHHQAERSPASLVASSSGLSKQRLVVSFVMRPQENVVTQAPYGSIWHKECVPQRLSDSVKNALLKELQDGGENCASWLKMAQPGRSIEAARARSVHACFRVAVFLVLFAVAVAMRGGLGSPEPRPEVLGENLQRLVPGLSRDAAVL